MKHFFAGFFFTFLFAMYHNPVQAQKDFDYSFYTLKADMINQLGKDTLHLTLFRKVQKEADVLKFVSLVNTGDTKTYTISFVGYEANSRSLTYLTGEGLTVFINPMEGTATVVNTKTNSKTIHY